MWMTDAAGVGLTRSARYITQGASSGSSRIDAIVMCIGLSYEMPARFNGARVASILPEGALPLLSLIEFSSGPAGYQLHGPSKGLPFPAFQHEQMDWAMAFLVSFTVFS